MARRKYKNRAEVNNRAEGLFKRALSYSQQSSPGRVGGVSWGSNLERYSKMIGRARRNVNKASFGLSNG